MVHVWLPAVYFADLTTRELLSKDCEFTYQCWQGFSLKSALASLSLQFASMASDHNSIKTEGPNQRMRVTTTLPQRSHVWAKDVSAIIALRDRVLTRTLKQAGYQKTAAISWMSCLWKGMVITCEN